MGTMKKKEEKRWRRWRRRKEKKESGSVKKRKSGEGNDLEVSLKTRKGTKIYEIPKLPLIIIWVITPSIIICILLNPCTFIYILLRTFLTEIRCVKFTVR